MLASIFSAVIFFVLIAGVISSIRIVKQQSLGIVETLGKYSRTLSPGLNFILPWGISSVVRTLELRLHENRAEVEVKTKDNAFVQMPVSVMVRVNPEKAVDAYYKLNKPNEQINRWVLNSVRSIAAQMTLNELFEDRERIHDGILKEVAPKMESFGYTLETILIEQPSVSAELQMASNRVVTAEREREAATQEGIAAKIRIVAAAEAESEAQVKRAEGIAKSRTTLISGLKENIEAIKDTGADVHDVMQLLTTINRLDAMRDIGAHGNLVVMDAQDPGTALDVVTAKKLLSK